MRKLGLPQGPQVETKDCDHYIKLFCEGLSEQQVRWIGKLFMQSIPEPEEQQEVA
jgi:hypothetical protein